MSNGSVDTMLRFFNGKVFNPRGPRDAVGFAGLSASLPGSSPPQARSRRPSSALRRRIDRGDELAVLPAAGGKPDGGCEADESEDGEVVFSERTSLIFKSMEVRRFLDKTIDEFRRHGHEVLAVVRGMAQDDGTFTPFQLQVLRLEGTSVAHATVFFDVLNCSAVNGVLAGVGVVLVHADHSFVRETAIHAILRQLMGIAAFVSVFPFLWMVIGATNTSPDIIRGKVTPGSALLTPILCVMRWGSDSS